MEFHEKVGRGVGWGMGEVAGVGIITDYKFFCLCVIEDLYINATTTTKYIHILLQNYNPPQKTKESAP